jgi:Ca2+-binding RTX toxin-like protein
MPTYRVNSKGIAVGKSGNDLVYGNNKDNVLVGAGGDDILRGRGGIDIIDAGNGNDTLFGESGNDMLSGGYGLDTLVGGSGSDFFGFDTRPSINNIDVVDDFSVRYDTILLYKKLFKVSAASKGVIKSSAFWTGSAAHDSNDRLVYDNATGALYYDPDGTGAKAAVQFAQLDANLKLTHKDFVML